MNKTVDPRALGFSYNSYNESRKPPVFHTAMKLCRSLGQKAGELDAQAHELEMAIKDVRIASNGVEKAMALSALEEEVAKFLSTQ